MTRQPHLKPRTNTPKLSISPGHDEPEAVLAFMRECLVPILAEKFIASRNARTSRPTSAKVKERTTCALSKEAGQ